MHDKPARNVPLFTAVFPVPRVFKLWGIVAVIFLAAAISHMTALGNGYVLDDFKLIVGNEFIARWDNIKILLDPHTVLTPYPMRCGARPLTVLSLLIDHRLWALNPFGYHLTNILLHGCNAVVVFFLAFLILKHRKDTARFGTAVFAGLLYALHPVQAEAVDIASFRADVLVVLFYVSSLLFFIRAQTAKRRARIVCYFLALVSFLLALFSKEMALTLPLVLLLYYGLFQDRMLSRKTIVMGTVMVAVAAVFFMFFWRERFEYSLYSSIFPNIRENLSPAASPAAYVNTLSSSLLHYAITLFYPAHLSIDYLIKSAKTLLLFRLGAALALVAALAVAMYRSSDRMLKFGIGMFLLTYLPVSNLVPLINTVNDRYMYLPMAGFSLAVSSVVCRLPEFRIGSLLSLRLLVIGAVLAYCGWLTVQRNFVFEDGFRLYGDAVRRVPENIRVRYNLGIAYMTKRNFRNAIEEFERTGRLNPFFKRDDSWCLTGICYDKLGDQAQAKKYYDRSLRLNAKRETFDAYVDLLDREGNVDGVIQLMKASVGMYPEPARYNNLGVYYARKDDLAQAIQCFRKALELEPELWGAWDNLLYACSRTGDQRAVTKETFRLITQLARHGIYVQKKPNARSTAGGTALLPVPGSERPVEEKMLGR